MKTKYNRITHSAITFFLFFLSHVENPWTIINLIFNRPTEVKVRELDQHKKLLLSKGFSYLGEIYKKGWRVDDINKNIIYMRRNDIIMGGLPY